MTFKPLPTHNYTVRAEPEQDLNYQENTMKIQSLDKIKWGGEVENGLKTSFWWLQRSLVLIHGFLPCTFHFKKVNWKHYVLPFCLDLKPACARSSAAWLR